MKRFIEKVGCFFIIASFVSCTGNTINKPGTCSKDMDSFDFSFGIDYNDPDKYLVPGEQSDLNDDYLEEIRSIIGTPELTIDGIYTVYDWFDKNFRFTNEGGAKIGKVTVDVLYELKAFYGCHSGALILTSVLREFGFPTVIIETASVDWAYDYIDGGARTFIGHVMTEVYVMNKWILLDNNNRAMLEVYDCMNPHIASSSKLNYGTKGLFCYAKGKDTWDYGVKSESDTHDLMRDFANDITCFEDLITY